MMRNILLLPVSLLLLLSVAHAQSYCRVRLLVAYTDSAMLQLGSRLNMEEAIYTAVAEINDSYFYSNVQHWVELVRTCQVNFAESSCFISDLQELSTNRTANQLRELYQADVVAFIVNNPQYCGQNLAQGQVAQAENAFVAVHWACLLGNYSLPHQIGHLYGCAHDHYLYEEADSAPYPYGHGTFWSYGEGDASFRTIMAISDDLNCANPDNADQCIMIPRWSNPRVPYQQVLTGMPGRSDNARVLNENAEVLAAFKSISPTYSIPKDSVIQCNFSLAQGSDTLRNDTTYHVKDSAQAFFRAGQRIVLQPGFQVEEGAYFETLLDTAVGQCQ